MDSATRAALLDAMTAAPAPEFVASVAKPDSPLATAETRRNPPFVASVAMLPAKESNPAETPPEIPGWAEPDLATGLARDFCGDVASDNPVFLATLATWQQSAEIRHPELLPSENPAGNAGNKPHDWTNLAALGILETPELIGRAELLYGGKIGLNASGPVWRDHDRQPPAEVMAILSERRLDVQAVLRARGHAAKTRTREPDSWGAAEWLAYFHERAGILEHDGGTPRATAELMARAECAEHWLCRNSPAPGGLENGCWQCGEAGTDPDGADPMTTRICRGGVFWLHPRCWADYDAGGRSRSQGRARAHPRGRVMTAEEITAALGGRWFPAGYGKAGCPAHGGEGGSLTVKDDPTEPAGIFAICHVGCHPSAVRAALAKLGPCPRWRRPRARDRS